MRKTKCIVKSTTQFKKDYKLALKRCLNVRLLENVIAALAMGEALPEKNKDHGLSGNWDGHRECHILPDRLTEEFGKGFNLRNPCYMRQFYLAFPNVNALRSELSWDIITL